MMFALCHVLVDVAGDATSPSERASVGTAVWWGAVVTVSQNLALVLMVNKGLLLIVRPVFRPVSIWRMALLGIGSFGLVK